MGRSESILTQFSEDFLGIGCGLIQSNQGLALICLQHSFEDSIHVPLLGYEEILVHREWFKCGVKHIINILCSCLSHGRAVP